MGLGGMTLSVSAGLGSTATSGVESPILVTNTKSIDFDGGNDYIDLGTEFDSIDSLAAFTFVAWIKASNTGGSEPIFSKVKDDNENLTIKLSGNKLYFMVENGSDSDGYIAYTDNDWNHIACVFDGSQTGNADRCKIYINGVNQTLTFSGTIPSTIDDLSGYSSYIGRQASAYYTGNIDEVGIWSSALTATEVKAIYDNIRLDFTQNSVGYASSSNLQGWWRMGDGDTYQVVADRRKTFFTGSSINFDGTDNFAIIEDHADFTFGDGSSDSAFSVSAWINPDALDSFDGIISKYATSHREWTFGIQGNDEKLRFFTRDESTGAYVGQKVSSASNTANVWQHVVGTYSGNGASTGFKLYIDGDLISSSDYEGGSTYTAMENKSGNVEIGKYLTDYSNGKITDVAIWNAELDANTITSIYNSGEPNDLELAASYTAGSGVDKTSNLKGYWRLGRDGDSYAPDFGTLTNSQAANVVISNEAQPITTWGSNIMSFNYTSADVGGTFVTFGTDGSGTMTGNGTEYIAEMDGGSYVYILLRARDDSGTSLAITGKTVKITMDIKADATFAGNNFELSNTYTETGGQQYVQPTTSYETITFYALPNSNYLGKWQLRTDGILYMKNIAVYIGDGVGHAMPSNSSGVTDFEEHAPNRHSGNMTSMASGDIETDVPS